MMTLKEICTSAAALGNQLTAGLPIARVLTRMAQLQPKYADFWTRAAIQSESGQPLSASLGEVWPVTLIGAVKAGEQSGKLENVFAQIEETALLQLRLRGAVFRLAYPVGSGIVGLVVFICFMTWVIPALAAGLGTASKSWVFVLSSWMSGTVKDNWAILLGGTVGAAVLAYNWVCSEDGQKTLLELALGVPVVRDALRDLYFGLWAHYMAMMVSAGITTINALQLTDAVLPPGPQDSIRRFERDLSANNRTLSDAADTAKLTADDPRTIWWPFYISNAFIVAEQTQEIDKELLRVAGPLIKEGENALGYVIWVTTTIAIAVSGLLIVSPLAAYYTEIFAAMRAVR